MNELLRQDLAIVDPVPQGSKLQGKPVGYLSDHIQAVFRARYDGRAETIRQLADELQVTRTQIISWAEELGIRNRVQPTPPIKHIYPAYPAVPEEDDDEVEEKAAVVEAHVIDEKKETTPATGHTRTCKRCKQERSPDEFIHRRGITICNTCRNADPAPNTAPKPAREPAPTMVTFPEANAARTAIAFDMKVTPPPPPVHLQRETPEPPTLLLDVLQHLPAGRAWTSARRERWVRAFLASLDLVIDEYVPGDVGVGSSGVQGAQGNGTDG